MVPLLVAGAEEPADVAEPAPEVAADELPDEAADELLLLQAATLTTKDAARQATVNLRMRI